MTFESLSKFATFALVACAVVLTSLVVRREVFPSRTASVGTGPTFVQAAATVAAVGCVRGDSTAAFAIVEFSDFQCPYCRAFAVSSDSVRWRAGLPVRFVFRHFPARSNHPFAYQAAVASECAGAQGRFWEYHDLLFAKDTRLGDGIWADLARTSGVGDLKRFRMCLASDAPRLVVDRDIAEGKRIGVRATPSILVRDTLYMGALSATKLTRLVRGRL